LKAKNRRTGNRLSDNDGRFGRCRQKDLCYKKKRQTRRIEGKEEYNSTSKWTGKANGKMTGKIREKNTRDAKMTKEPQSALGK